ncbi:MAG: DUF1062 domain-containing protein [Rhizobium sp.]
MCTFLRVRWTVTPRIAPQPWIACSGCGGFKPFSSSGKIRLNANGRKLDAWLIYKCSACDKTWNRTLFERQTVRSLAPAVLEALQTNDIGWIRAQEFDLDALRRKAQRVDEFTDLNIGKQVLERSDGCGTLDIELAVTFPVSTRLDRLLASELGISRSRLHALHDEAKLQVHPDRAGILKRRVRDGMRIVLNLAGQADGHLVNMAATSPQDND